MAKYSPFVIPNEIDDDGAMLIAHSNTMYYAYLALVETQKIRSETYYMIPFWNVFRKISWSIKTKQSTKKLHENYIKYEYGRRIVYAYCKKYGFDVIDTDNHAQGE